MVSKGPSSSRGIGIKRDRLKGTNGVFSQFFFADFRWFLQILAFPGNYSISEAQINRRFSQKTADFRRKPQIFAETGLSHLVCPLQFRPNPREILLFGTFCPPPFSSAQLIEGRWGYGKTVGHGPAKASSGGGTRGQNFPNFVRSGEEHGSSTVVIRVRTLPAC